MSQGLLVFIVGFLLSFVAVKLFTPIAVWANLVDKPGGRKHHEGMIPLIGGLAIFSVVAFNALVFIGQSDFIQIYIMATGAMMLIGLVDDRYDISAKLRLLAQLLICSVFVFVLDIRVVTLGDLFGFGDIPLGYLSYPFSILCLMSIINAFNMLDGMDGLVGAVSIVVFTVLSILYSISGHVLLELICFSYVAAITAFLIFNLCGCTDGRFMCKVFMGDAGSMFLGLSIGVLIIYGSQYQQSMLAFSPISTLWFVLLPVTDMFTLIYRRLKRGRSPMSPDRTHIHHILLRAGFNKIQTLTIIVFFQVLFMCLGALLFKWGAPEWLSFTLALFFVVAYQLLMKRSWRFIRITKRYLFSQSK